MMKIMIFTFMEDPCPIYLMLEKLNLNLVDKESQGRLPRQATTMVHNLKQAVLRANVRLPENFLVQGYCDLV